MTLLIHLGLFGALNVLVLLLGYRIIGSKQLLIGWLLFVLSVAAVHFIFLHDSPIIRMLGLLSMMFTAMKVVVVTETYKNRTLPLSFKQWSLFATGWVGMRAEPFEHLGEPPLPGVGQMVRFGVIRIVIGALFILLAHGLAIIAGDNLILHALTGLSALMGLSFILHFGLLSISAGMWRKQGVPAYFLFRQPARSTTLSEFWGKRWNLAFIEMNAIILFRPIKNKVGMPVALLLAFLFSGVLHELAISLPVNAGFGRPTLYFLIQGVLVLIEKQLELRGISLNKNKWVGRVWTFLALAIPLPLLFHPAFMNGVVFPLTGIRFN